LSACDEFADSRGLVEAVVEAVRRVVEAVRSP
jgi:hypothetical protein